MSDINVLISVIIPVYNSAKYLKKCLESVISQSYKFIEIIVVDDGSTDGSSTICDKYAEIDSRFIVIHKRNKGVSAARNQGIEIATGEYIVFVDSDDYIEYDYVEQMANALKKKDYDLVICGYFDVFDYMNKKISHTVSITDVASLTGNLQYDYSILSKFTKFPVLKLYKKSVITYWNVKFPEHLTDAEDQCFNFKYLSYVEKYKLINKPLYYYVHSKDASLSKLCTKKSFESNFEKLLLERKFFEDNRIENKEVLMCKSIFRIVQKYIILSDTNDTYAEYLLRVKKVRKLFFNFDCDYSTKSKVAVWLMKNNIILPIYLYYRLKRLIA